MITNNPDTNSDLHGVANSAPLSSDLQEIRNILCCTCWFNETNHGKAWNLKTEQYEDCECVEKITALELLIQSRERAAVEEALQKIMDWYLNTKIAPYDGAVIDKVKHVLATLSNNEEL